MKKRLSEFTEKECIHIDNENDWKRIVKEDSDFYNSFYKIEKICYYPKTDEFSSLDYAQKNNFTIYQPSDVILEDEYSYLEEVEVSDKGIKWIIRKYLCKEPDGCFLAWNDNLKISDSYKFIRKPQTEKTKAIESIKELAKQHNIKLSEL